MYEIKLWLYVDIFQVFWHIFLKFYLWHCTEYDTYTAQILVDRDSAAGITTLYGLEGPETESRWGEGGKFPAPVLTGPGDFLAFY